MSSHEKGAAFAASPGSIDVSMPRRRIVLVTSDERYENDEKWTNSSGNSYPIVNAIVVDGRYYIASDIYYCAENKENQRGPCRHEECKMYTNVVLGDDEMDWLEEAAK